MIEEEMFIQVEKDRMYAVDWARDILANRDRYYILDTETTGPTEPEIVGLAIIDLDGNAIVNQRFRPYGEIEDGSMAVHHITPAIANRYPRWDVGADRLSEILTERKLLIYNSAFDYKALRISYVRSGRPMPSLIPSDCVMHWYSQYCGDWNDYHQSYRWQKLPGGDHSAMGNCIAALEVIKEMAQE